jgi:hypothetical protein
LFSVLSILRDFIDVMSGKRQITGLDCRKLNHWEKRFQWRVCGYPCRSAKALINDEA